jgi:hypothetical protein
VPPSASKVENFVRTILDVRAGGVGASLAPWVSSTESQAVLKALCEGLDPLFSDSVRRLTVLDEDVHKFDAAVNRADLMEIAQEAVLSVLGDPQAHPNLCVARGKKGSKDLPYASRTVLPGVFDDGNHPTVRFTLYRIVQSKLGYSAGARVPLPATLETLLRAVFPCSPKGLFDGTGFIPSQPRVNDSELDVTGPSAGRDDAGGGASGLPPLYPNLPPLYPADTLHVEGHHLTPNAPPSSGPSAPPGSTRPVVDTAASIPAGSSTWPAGGDLWDRPEGGGGGRKRARASSTVKDTTTE